MGIFHKNLVHPNLSSQDNDEQDGHELKVMTPSPIEGGSDSMLIIPMSMTSDIGYLERRLNNSAVSLMESFEVCNNFIIRRYLNCGNDEVPLESKPYKYEVLESSSGRSLYVISEQTEYFIRNTACCSKPSPMDFVILSSMDGEIVAKLTAVFGVTGYFTKIQAKQYNRPIGEVRLRTSIVPIIGGVHYSIKDYNDNEIITMKSMECCKLNLLCNCNCLNAIDSNNYEIKFGSGRFSSSKGQLHKEGRGLGDSYYHLDLFHGSDAIGKLLLISAILLVDLRSNSGTRIFGICQCNLLTCLLQCVASICFYVIVLFMVGSILYLIFVS